MFLIVCVVFLDIVPEKVEIINNKKSPIQDDYIEKYLAEKELDLTATLDGETAYKNADYLHIHHRFFLIHKQNFVPKIYSQITIL